MINSEWIKGFVFILSALFPILSYAQNKTDNNIGLRDPSVRTGKLANGFTYYLHNYDDPERKVNFQFVVKTGNNAETAEEYQYAHLVEHLAFLKTKNFPNGVRTFLSKYGLGPGTGLGASTAEMFTCYDLCLPANLFNLMDTAIQIFSDYSGRIIVDEKILIPESNVVVAEVRQRSRNEIITKEQKILAGQSYYISLDRKGGHLKTTSESMKNVTSVSIQKFIDKWYRPDLQALIIVGKIDIDGVETMIKKYFSGFQKIGEAPAYITDVRKGDLSERKTIEVIAGSNISDIKMSVNFRQANPYVKLQGPRDYWDYVKVKLLDKLLSRRFVQLPKQYMTPLMSAMAKRNFYDSQIDLMSVWGYLSDPKQIDKFGSSIFTELEQIRVWGFSTQEVQEAKRLLEEEILSEKEIYSIRESMSRKYLEHFVNGTTVLKDSEKEELILSFIKKIDSLELNRSIKNWLDIESNLMIVLTVPEVYANTIGSKVDVTRWVQNAKKESLVKKERDISGFKSLSFVNAPNVSSKPVSVKMMEEDFSSQVFGLANGTKVSIFRSDTSKTISLYMQGNIQIPSTSGTSIMMDNAVGIMNNSGAGNLNKFEFHEYLKRNAIDFQLSFSRDFNEVQIAATCPYSNFETLLKIIDLIFTRPRMDSLAFEDWKISAKSGIRAEKANGDLLFFRMINSARMNSPILTERDIESCDMDSCMSIFRKLISKANFIVGISANPDSNIDKALLSRYLTFSERVKSTNAPEISVNRSSMKRTFYGSAPTQAEVRLYFPFVTSSKGGLREKLLYNIIEVMLFQRMFARLREKEGGVYTPRVAIRSSESISNFKDDYFLISFGCDPNKVEQLIAASIEEIEILTGSNIDTDYFRSVKSKVSVNLSDIKYGQDLSIHKKLFILNNNEKPETYKDWEKALDNITVHDIQNALKQCLSVGRLQQFVSMPAKFAGQNQLTTCHKAVAQHAYDKTSGLHTGTLSNGFKYYVHANNNPSGRIEIRFVVKAGTFNETSGQEELAHLTEHLGFEGTRHFPGNSLMNYLSSKGLSIGRAVNASTGGNKTDYKISIPGSDSKLLDSCLLITRDWAQDFVLSEERVKVAANAVRAEIMLKSGDTKELIDRYVTGWIINNGRYGDERHQKSLSNMRNATAKNVQEFYDKHYIPSVEAIIIVGDIDANSTIEKIETLFSDIRKPAHKISGSAYSSLWKTGLLKEPRIKVFEDQTGSKDMLEVYFKKLSNFQVTRSISDYKNKFLLEFFPQLIARRLYEINQRSDKKISTSILQNYRYSNLDFLRLECEINDAREISQVLELMFTEIRRMALHGFYAVEFDEMKRKFLMWMRSYQIDDKSSGNLAEKYTSSFVDNTLHISDTIERALINEIKVEDANRFFRNWLKECKDIDVVIRSKKIKGNEVPSSPAIQKLIKSVSYKKLDPIVYKESIADSLMQSIKISFNRQPDAYSIEEFGKEGWMKMKFENGIQVFLMPLNAKKEGSPGNIELMAYSYGGSEAVVDNKRIIAELSNEVVANLGVGNFDKKALASIRSDIGLSVRPDVGRQYESMNAECPGDQVEAMFKLMHLFFTSPRIDHIAFEKWKLNIIDRIAEIEKNDEYRITNVLSYGNSIKTAAKADIVDMKMEEVIDLYRNRFASGNDFTFFISGSFDIKEVELLAAKYISALPNGKRDAINLNNGDRIAPTKAKEVFILPKVRKREGGFIIQVLHSIFIL